MSSSYLVNKFLKEVDDSSYSYFSCKYFNEVNDLVITYIEQGMKLKSKLDKIIFQKAEYVYIYIILINHGYVFTNMYALCDFISKISEIIPKNMDKLSSSINIIEAINILESNEMQKYIKSTEIVIKDKDIDDILKVSYKCYNPKTILHELIIMEFKDNDKIVWPKIIYNLDKYEELKNEIVKQKNI